MDSDSDRLPSHKPSGRAADANVAVIASCTPTRRIGFELDDGISHSEIFAGVLSDDIALETLRSKNRPELRQSSAARATSSDYLLRAAHTHTVRKRLT